METKTFFFKFEAIINVLVGPLSVHSNTYVMGLSGHFKYFNSFSASQLTCLSAYVVEACSINELIIKPFKSHGDP